MCSRTERRLQRPPQPQECQQQQQQELFSPFCLVSRRKTHQSTGLLLVGDQVLSDWSSIHVRWRTGLQSSRRLTGQPVTVRRYRSFNDNYHDLQLARSRGCSASDAYISSDLRLCRPSRFIPTRLTINTIQPICLRSFYLSSDATDRTRQIASLISIVE